MKIFFAQRVDDGLPQPLKANIDRLSERLGRIDSRAQQDPLCLQADWASDVRHDYVFG
jgi:hypothetical protein